MQWISQRKVPLLDGKEKVAYFFVLQQIKDLF